MVDAQSIGACRKVQSQVRELFQIGKNRAVAFEMISCAENQIVVFDHVVEFFDEGFTVLVARGSVTLKIHPRELIVPLELVVCTQNIIFSISNVRGM